MPILALIISIKTAKSFFLQNDIVGNPAKHTVREEEKNLITLDCITNYFPISTGGKGYKASKVPWENSKGNGYKITREKWKNEDLLK